MSIKETLQLEHCKYLTNYLSPSCLCQTLQMGISHFSGLFVLLCVGVGGALLTLAGEHGFYQLALPYIRRRQKLKYWLHTSQVRLQTWKTSCCRTIIWPSSRFEQGHEGGRRSVESIKEVQMSH